MNRGFKALLLCLSGILIFIAVSVGSALGPKLYYMKSEYVTASVIAAADRFVGEHPKKWPKSWQDLGSEDLSRYTEFRFDLTPELIARDRQLIYSAIQPKCHRYRTYPHARVQLDALYERLTSASSRK